MSAQPPSLDALRRHAVVRSLRRAPSLLAAIRHMGYVQADPIRSPARAQDLILRHRVPDYRADALERRYAALPVFEDTIYNYGFFPQTHYALLHPRRLAPHWRAFARRHRQLRDDLLALLTETPALHPREAARTLGDTRRTNGWGGTSSTVTLLLETLHREGLARVVRREAGIRVYAPAPEAPAMDGAARAAGLVDIVVRLYAPMQVRALRPYLNWMGRVRDGVDCHGAYRRGVHEGCYVEAKVDGAAYVWPADESWDDALDDEVRLLAPFDPIVWDRGRFEHFWQWPYRFEAYTPAAQRQFGYYALPMLWRDQVIGWANASVQDRHVTVAPALAKRLPLDAAFHAALDREATRFAAFLGAPRA